MDIIVGDKVKVFGQIWEVVKTTSKYIFIAPPGIKGIAKRIQDWSVDEVNGVKVNR